MMEEPTKESRHLTDEEMLQEIKDAIRDGVKEGTIKPKVGDLLKILELQRKLASDTKAEEKFWEVIEQLRQGELKNE